MFVIRPVYGLNGPARINLLDQPVDLNLYTPTPIYVSICLKEVFCCLDEHVKANLNPYTSKLSSCFSLHN